MLKRTFPVLLFATLTLLSLGCGDSGQTGQNCTDSDGDGYSPSTSSCPSGRDCDDSDRTIHPKAKEKCGNGIDEDCSGDDKSCSSSDECKDEDGDGYGEGSMCKGPDCDDTEESIHPDAVDICENGVDEDCSGSDASCDSNCTDQDGDGWGPKGQNSGCTKNGVDCDDSNKAINPEAEEICNMTDDNCNSVVDECDNPDAACEMTATGMRCISTVGGKCSSSKQCPKHTSCETEIDPDECRKERGAGCTGSDQCLDDLSCNDGYCTGSWCGMQSCPRERKFCDDENMNCVECRHWYGEPLGELPDCSGQEVCLAGGWCGGITTIDSAMSVPPYRTVTQSILDISKTLADCWNDLKGLGKDLCVAVDAKSGIQSPVTEQQIKDAYDEFKKARMNMNLSKISSKQVDALDDLFGDGLGDLKNLTWKTDIQPASEREVCIWFDPHGIASRSRLHIDSCSKYTKELP